MPVSNFRTGGADAYWDTALDDGAVVRQTCNGNTFVATLQNILRTRITRPLNGYERSVTGSEITVDGKWGPTTSNALYAHAVSLGVDRYYLDEIAHEGRAHNLSVAHPASRSPNVPTLPIGISASVLIAAWMLNRTWMDDPTDAPHPAQMIFYPGTIFPAWGILHPRNASTTTACTTVTTVQPRQGTIPDVQPTPPVVTPTPPDRSTPPVNPNKPNPYLLDVVGRGEGGAPQPTGGQTPQSGALGATVVVGLLAAVGFAAYALTRTGASLVKEQQRGRGVRKNPRARTRNR